MSAKNIFDTIIKDGWSGVRRWKDTEAEESLHLEFKRQEDIKSSDLGDRDKGQLGKTLSGFANIEGGVLVFGVHAKDLGKKPDRVQSICPFDDAARFQAAVERNIPNLTDPPIGGVKVERIEDPDKPGTGVVAVHVPLSLGGPHRVINGPAEITDRYYMRTASQTVNMPHAVLASMFSRNAQPALQLVGRWTTGARQGTQLTALKLVLNLRNSGRGAARQPAIQVYQNELLSSNELIALVDADVPGWNVTAQQPYKNNPGFVTMRSDPRVIIYPGEDTPILPPRETSLKEIPAGAILRLKGIIYALDMQPISFDGEETYQDQLFNWDFALPKLSDPQD